MEASKSWKDGVKSGVYAILHDEPGVSQILNPSKNTLGIFCLSVTLAILTAGLWPFNFWPENKVKWLKDENGVNFYGRGIIISEPSSNNPQFPLFHSGPITLGIWLQPDNEPNSYLPRILSAYDGKGSEEFFLAQWKSTLILRTKVLSPKNIWTYRGIGIGNVLLKGQRPFIAITSDDKGTSIYVDGKLEGSYPDFSFIPKDRTILNQIILGNSPTGGQHWTGNLLGLAFYNHSLTNEQACQHFQEWLMKNESALLTEEGLVSLFFFDEQSGVLAHDRLNHNHLLIPSRFIVLKKRILIPLWKGFRLNRSYLMDVLTNILGFIPLGLFFSAYLWGKKPRSFYPLLFFAILLGGGLSLSIELAQAFLPTRDSQLMDVISNTLGTILGVIGFHFCNHKYDAPLMCNLSAKGPRQKD